MMFYVSKDPDHKEREDQRASQMAASISHSRHTDRNMPPVSVVSQGQVDLKREDTVLVVGSFQRPARLQ